MNGMCPFSLGIEVYAGGGSKSGSWESGTKLPSLLLDDLGDEMVVMGPEVDPSGCS